MCVLFKIVQMLINYEPCKQMKVLKIIHMSCAVENTIETGINPDTLRSEFYVNLKDYRLKFRGASG